jgi:hypothetical protein
MMHPYLYAEYTERVDLAGQNLIGLLDARRESLQAAIPTLRDVSTMTMTQGSAEVVTTHDTGEIADEIHYFVDGWFGEFKMSRIMLKRGRVIQIDVKYR